MFNENHEKTFPNSDFRLFLQQEFIKRCKKNPRYSLRAFAKTLSIQPSPLSAILRGKRPITAKMKTRLGLTLGLSLEELKEYDSSSSARKQQNEFQQLTIDNYAIISDWYHYAILELIRVKSFKSNVNYISKALNISETEVQIAIERLQRVGLLEIKKNGKFIDTTANGLATNIHQDLTSSASKKLQKQILEKAIMALLELPTSVRSQTSMTMAINPIDLPEAKKRIQEFRRDMCAFFEKNKNPTQVYNLGVSLYPITNLEE